MVSGKVIIKNPTGLHLRPAGYFAKQPCNLAQKLQLKKRLGLVN